MSRTLLDVSVLIALVDPDHLEHGRVHAWAEDALTSGWASCAITENGFVRILSQPAYPGSVSVAEAIALLRAARGASDHEFWPCDLSIADPAHVDAGHLLGHRQVTDAYLLALAVSRDAPLATLDRSVASRAALGASRRHLIVI